MVARDGNFGFHSINSRPICKVQTFCHAGVTVFSINLVVHYRPLGLFFGPFGPLRVLSSRNLHALILERSTPPQSAIPIELLLTPVGLSLTKFPPPTRTRNRAKHVVRLHWADTAPGVDRHGFFSA